MVTGLANRLRPLLAAIRRLQGRASLRTWRLSSPKPLSRSFGFDRGQPVDRYYIEHFLGSCAGDVRGVVLEVGASTYSRRFGRGQVTTQHIVDNEPRNPDATITGDLSQPGVLPPATFDCIVLTQTLHTIFDMPAAIRQLRGALRPGGVLLITAPGISPVRTYGSLRWYWSLTEESLLRLLLLGGFEPAKVSSSTFGNLFAATNFLHGAAVEELAATRLAPVDPAYPVIVAARAVA